MPPLPCHNLSTNANWSTKRTLKCKSFTHVLSVQSEFKSEDMLTTKNKNSPSPPWKDPSNKALTFTQESSTHGHAETKKTLTSSFQIFTVPTKCSIIITTMPSNKISWNMKGKTESKLLTSVCLTRKILFCLSMSPLPFVKILIQKLPENCLIFSPTTLLNLPSWLQLPCLINNK